ncbi:MAG: helix-turn-helix domain-containing protein [Bacilli bacterium]|nr:helix-turn-helix domain-containing protein [Bacilli bacterium]
MSTYYSTSFSSKNIQFIHRAIIAKALKDGDTVTEIAKELHFSRQAIHSEIKRGTFDKLTSELDMVKVYDPYKAEYAHLSSQQFKGRLLMYIIKK